MALSRSSLSKTAACYNRLISSCSSSSSTSFTPTPTSTSTPPHASRRSSLRPVLLGKPSSFRPPPTSRTMSTTTPPRLRSLNIDNINPHVCTADYAVRGEIAVKSEAYRAQLLQHPDGSHGLPFDSVISANIGNPQQLDQKPITFFRQVLSLLEYPPLLEKEDVLLNQLGYKKDVIERARWLLSQVGSVGAYSASTGPQGIRESIAKFIEERDGHPADPSSIYLTAGASSGVNTLLHVICAGPHTGVLVPIPQYPLYTATLSLLNAACVPYYLDESHHWATDISSITDALSTAATAGTDVRAIAIINPGNPTGASLSYADIEAVIALAARSHLVILADEVYQTNVFVGKFHSFKSVLRDMQRSSPGTYDNVELVSLHSVSKGIVGECGHRGGYFELVGFDPAVVEQIYKFISISLCAPVIGQCLVELMVNPPRPSDPSYPLYKTEVDSIAAGLLSRATALHKAFQTMEGVQCGDPQGAMYLFPTITIPAKAVEAAERQGKLPDAFYAMRMLEETGVCVVPGSGFGQKEGTWHFRTTFLAPGTEWVERVRKFHERFMEEFR